MSCTTSTPSGAAASSSAARARTARVHDRLQGAAALRVAEHQPTHGGPVEVAVVGEDLGTEGVHDRRQPLRPAADDLPREDVGVDDHGPQVGQDRRDRALARGHAARQSHSHGPHRTGVPQAAPKRRR